jgi:hypothetical protein
MWAVWWQGAAGRRSLVNLIRRHGLAALLLLGASSAASCADQSVAPPKANEGLPDISLSVLPAHRSAVVGTAASGGATALHEQYAFTTDSAAEVRATGSDTPVVLLAASAVNHNGGVSRLEVDVSGGGLISARATAVVSHADPNGKWPNTLRLLGTDGNGNSGPQAISFTYGATVRVSAWNTHGIAHAIRVTFAKAFPNARLQVDCGAGVTSTNCSPFFLPYFAVVGTGFQPSHPVDVEIQATGGSEDWYGYSDSYLRLNCVQGNLSGVPAGQLANFCSRLVLVRQQVTPDASGGFTVPATRFPRSCPRHDFSAAADESGLRATVSGNITC